MKGSHLYFRIMALATIKGVGGGGTKISSRTCYYGFYLIEPRAMIPGVGSARTLISVCLTNTGYCIMSPQSGIENPTDKKRESAQ